MIDIRSSLVILVGVRHGDGRSLIPGCRGATVSVLALGKPDPFLLFPFGRRGSATTRLARRRACMVHVGVMATPPGRSGSGGLSLQSGTAALDLQENISGL